MQNNNQITEIVNHLNNGGTYQNDVAGYQFVKRADGAMFHYNSNTGKYKFFNDINKMARRILKALNTGR